MEPRQIITEFFVIACNLDRSIEKRLYFRDLSYRDEANYNLFAKFATACSNTLLCMLHKLGHCGGDNRLENIIRELVQKREALAARKEYYETDAGGYVNTFLQRNGVEEGKLTINMYLKQSIQF